MNLASAPFYTSGTFWAAVAVPVAILIGVATVWVTWLSPYPKRRLLYSMPVTTSMLNRQSDVSDELRVIYGTKQLDCPYVVNVQLTGKGRSDIPRDAFDGGKPLCLDVGTPIVECLQVTTTPADRPEPLWTIDSSKLLIGPSLIGKRQVTVFSLLVDGPTPHLSPPEQSLVDVDLRSASSSEPFIWRQRPMPLVSFFFLLLGAGLVFSQAPQHGAVVAAAAGCFAAAALWEAIFMRPPRR